MAQNVTFNINLRVDGKDVIQKVTMNVEELRHVIDEAKDSSEKLSASLINFNQRAETFQTISDSVSQLAGTLNTLTEESRSYGSAMAAANTMAGKSGEEFDELKSKVSELAETVPVARDELANGLYQVISNGVPEDNWLEFLNKSAKASVGGMADLGETVKVTSTIIKNYGLEWDAAGEIQDKIQLTAKNGVTSFEQMAQALPRVASQASNLGVNINELMASFATLTGVSGNTAEVSTQLAAIFTALIKPSSEATEMAEQMGIQFDAAAIKAAGGMSNFITQLDKDVKSYAQSSGMLEQEIYGKLFGSAESLRALTPLTNQLADKFKENIDSMAGSAGTMDSAFDMMASTGKAKLQILNNKLGEVSDVIQATFGNALPYLNFSSQVLISISSVAQLGVSLKSLGVAFNIVTIASTAMNKARLSGVAVSRVLTAALRGEAVGATTAALATRAFSVAIRGLMIATGVGIVVAALTATIEHLATATDEAADSATDMADAEQQAADSVKQTYDSTLKQTYADLMAKYDRLKESWKALRTEHEKTEWIKKNKSAFDELKIKVNSVTDAENVFQKNTNAVVEAFTKRAEAAAYAAKLTELYQKQIALTDKKNKTIGAIANDAKQNGRHASEGDLIPEGWRYERYGGVGNDGKWRFSKEGAERYSGTNTSGNRTVETIDASIAQVGKEIEDTKKQMASAAKSSGWIEPSTNPAPTSQSTNPHTSNNTTTNEDNPLKGSIDYYEKEISDLKKRIRATADEGTAITMQKELEAKEKALHEMKVRIGIETPEKEEIKTELEKMQEKLDGAQKEFDNATTIEAKVSANAKIADIQHQIDEATKGKLTIEADTEPSYVEQGSVTDKRQSYSNALQKAQRIQTDYEIGLIGKDEAKAQLEDLNKQVKDLGIGVKPIKIGVETEDVDKAKEKLKGATDAVNSMGSSLGNLGDAIDVPELNVAGTIAQAIATMVAGYATATTQAASMGPWAWIAFAATGLATLAAMITSVKQMGAFATGGIVGGNSKTGDRLTVRVNSGEMILNAQQQARLFAIANGASVYGQAVAVGGEFGAGPATGGIVAQLDRLQGLGMDGGTAKPMQIKLKVRGRDLIEASGNELRSTRKRSHLR